MKKTIKILVVSLFMILMVLSLIGCTKKYKLSPKEAVAWTTLRLAIAESDVYGGSTTLTNEYVDVLKGMVKNYNSNNEWFTESSLKHIGYGETIDTDMYEISTLSDGNYCATFKVENKNGTYYLVDYKFEKTSKKGSELFIVDKKSE